MADNISFTIHTNFDLTGSLGQEVRRKVAAHVAATAEEVGADYKHRITDNTGKTGRYYRRVEIHKTLKKDGKRAGQLRGMGLTEVSPGKFITGTRLHRASAPQQAPATDTGDLAANVQVDTEHADSDLYADIINSEEQALVLEVGGDNVEPRPALLPALKEAEDGYREGFTTILQEAGR